MTKEIVKIKQNTGIFRVLQLSGQHRLITTRKVSAAIKTPEKPKEISKIALYCLSLIQKNIFVRESIMKNIVIKYSFFVLFSAIFLIISAEKASGQNSISGMISDETRNPVMDIEVELLDEFERLIRSTKTKGAGVYIFQGLRAGIFYIQVRTAGTNYRA